MRLTDFRPIRVFVSSPGDVADERALARRLLNDELPRDPLLMHRYIKFDVVSWDDPTAPVPMDATLTPQEAVNRFGPKPSECDVVVVILWSRMGTHLDTRAFTKPDKKPYLSGTEWEFEDAVNAPKEKRPTVLVYRRTEEFKVAAKDPDRAEKFRQFDLVDNFLKRFQNVDGSFARGYSPYNTPMEFKQRLGNDIKFLLSERLLRPIADTTHVSPPNPKSAWIGSPYPGLRPFTSRESEIFFGRGRETDSLVARLRNPMLRFIAVAGASGSGKSSLIRAGLLPRLLDGALEGSQRWPVLTLTPGKLGSDPFLALAAALDQELPSVGHQKPVDLAQTLAKAPERLPGYIDAALADRPAESALVLFVDQFEELFTLSAETYRGPFAALLARAVEHPRVRVIVTLRMDFLPQCLAETSLASLLQAGTYLLGPPGPAALADMIRKPAALAGLDLDDELADEILRDAGTDAGSLPLVAFCLEELYRQTGPEHRLTPEAYRALNRLQGAIGLHLGRLIERIEQAEGLILSDSLSKLFPALIHVDASGTATRRWVSKGVLMTASIYSPPIVEALINGRILLAGETTTLAHDAFIHQWPALIAWLDKHRAVMQRVQRQLLNLKAPEYTDRLHAARELSELGAAAAEAVPALIAAFSDTQETVRSLAVTALASIGPSAVPALVAALQASGEQIPSHAVRALVGIGVPAVSSLAVCLSDSRDYVRQWASTALNGIGPASLAAAPALIACLQDSSKDVRKNAARALGQCGRAAAGAVPALIGVLQDPSEDVRQCAAQALGQINPTEALPALVVALDDPHEPVQRSASEALGNIGAAALPALIAALDDRNERVRQYAAKALGTIRPDSADAVRKLIAALDDPAKLVREHAANALGQIGPVGLLDLIEALKNRSGFIRAHAAQALGQVGADASEAVASLIITLGDPDEHVRQKSARALGQIGSATISGIAFRIGLKFNPVSDRKIVPGSFANGLVSAVVASLQDQDELVRQNATKALEAIGPVVTEVDPDLAATIVSALATILQNSNDPVKSAALQALGRIGVRATPRLAPRVVGAVSNSLHDHNEHVRQSALLTLGQLSSVAAGALPALAAVLRDDPNEGIRLQSQQLIVEIMRQTTFEPAFASAVVWALVAACKDTSKQVRKGAVNTLGHIGRQCAEVVPDLAATAVQLLGDTLKDASEEMRGCAAVALGRIGLYAAAAVPPLAAALDDISEEVGHHAANALKAIGPVGVASLMRARRDGAIRAQRRALRAMADVDRQERSDWNVIDDYTSY